MKPDRSCSTKNNQFKLKLRFEGRHVVISAHTVEGTLALIHTEQWIKWRGECNIWNYFENGRFHEHSYILIVRIVSYAL